MTAKRKRRKTGWLRETASNCGLYAQMGNSFESWYAADSSAINDDHSKHMGSIDLPKKDANVLLSREFNFPVDGTCNAIIAKVSGGFETTVERGDLHPTVHKSLTDSLTALICEVVLGEYAVVRHARGKRELYYRLTTGEYDYHLVSTIRYYISTVKEVTRLAENGIGKETDLEHTTVRAYVCSVITVLQKPTELHEEVRQALPQSVFGLPPQFQGGHEERDEC